MRRAGLVVLILAAAAVAPDVLGPYWMRVTVLSMLWFCLALGYNVVITDAGQFHLGFVAHFAMGAYTVAIAMAKWGWSFWSAALLAAAVSLAFALALGLLLLRFRGDYLSVVSLAAAEILRLTLANWRSVTGGYLGIPGVPAPELFGAVLSEQTHYLWLATLVAVAGVTAVWMLKASGIGLAWRGIRQNEPALRSVGVRVDYHKQLSFVVGGLLAGLAGAIYASYQTIVDPSLAAIDGTILLLTMVILGGGSILGLFIAAAVLTVMPEVMRVFEEYRLLLLGLFFVVMMNWRPDGFTRRTRPQYLAAEAAGDGASPVRTAAAGTALLEVSGATVRFGGLFALRDVSMTVRSGETLGLIGPNGAGKTTLFNVIAGLRKPISGTVRFGSQDIGDLSVERRSRLGIARTFQLLELCPDLTCLENVLLARIARGKLGRMLAAAAGTRTTEVARALWALEFVGIAGRADERAAALPYGDRRRLEIARALAADPAVLLLDEPAAGMNPAEAAALVGLIRRIRERGVTVVLIEHNVRLVREVCDRVVVLSSGERIAEGTPEEVIRDPRVIEAYLGRRYRVAA